jgi:hypothetical protein
MKKLLFSAVALLGALSICVSNFGNTGSSLPAGNHSYITRDTVPSDTTKPKDSSFLQLR